jgi:hypothetical protein
VTLRKSKLKGNKTTASEWERRYASQEEVFRRAKDVKEVLRADIKKMSE